MTPERDTEIRLALCFLKRDPMKKDLDKRMQALKGKNRSQGAAWKKLERRQEKYVIGAYPELFGEKK